MSSGPGAIKQLWFRWKTLKLPWRREFLVGFDLAGNTFWEFKDNLNANRLRRIVKYSRRTHYGDVKISPQWHQWLRHTRPEAPSVQEQQYEVSRQEMMKQRAAEADERWRSQPSFLDSPDKQQPVPAVAAGESNAPVEPAQSDGSGVISSTGDQEEVQRASTGEAEPSRGKPKAKKPSPWGNRQDQDGAEKLQQASWSPGVAKRR